MINSFDTDVAMDVGINAAIIYKNIQFWCEKNRANNKNLYDGYYWTFNSVAAFEQMFPYLSYKQIRGALTILEEKGYILSGNFNKSAYDRTKWYADIRVAITDKPICHNDKIDLPCGANEDAQEGEPIPYINTNINTDSKHKKERKKETFDEVLDSLDLIRENPDLREAFIEYIKMRKLIKKPLTDRALKLNINEAYKLSRGNAKKMQAIVEQSIQHSWAGMYDIKEKAQNKDTYFSDLLKEMEEQNEAGNYLEGVAGLPSAFPDLLQG